MKDALANNHTVNNLAGAVPHLNSEHTGEHTDGTSMAKKICALFMFVPPMQDGTQMIRPHNVSAHTIKSRRQPTDLHRPSWQYKVAIQTMKMALDGATK